MKKIFRKSISVVLCLCVVLCVPAFASAAETTIEYGSYPQSLVTDEATINSLNQLDKQFVSYGYYSGIDETIGTSECGDYMKYADVTLNGKEYRGVIFSAYRPNLTYMTSDTSHSYQDDNGYAPDTIYWFKYEPISWKVLDAKSGLCVTEKILDAQAFCAGFEYDGNMTYYSDSTHAHLANEYSGSKVSSWISGRFSSDAFSADELSDIIADNGSKVYLLSESKVEDEFENEESRKAAGTDYAKCQGLFVSNNYSSWLLSNSDTDAYSGLKVRAVKQSGTAGQADIFSSCFGIRPAAMIDSVIPRYTVEFFSENSYTKLILREDEAITKPADPSREGYTFKGWDKTIPEKMGTENLEFSATWEKKTYKVTWNMFGSKKEAVVAFGDPVVAPTPTIKYGCAFAGWDAKIPSAMPAHDLVFNAQYEDAYIEGIKIIKAPAKTEYIYKESGINLDGLEVETVSSDGTRTSITDKSQLSVKDFDTKSVGIKKVTVEYQGFEAQFNIRVSYTWWQQIIRFLLLGFIWY